MRVFETVRPVMVEMIPLTTIKFSPSDSRADGVPVSAVTV